MGREARFTPGKPSHDVLGDSSATLVPGVYNSSGIFCFGPFGGGVYSFGVWDAHASMGLSHLHAFFSLGGCC